MAGCRDLGSRQVDSVAVAAAGRFASICAGQYLRKHPASLPFLAPREAGFAR